VAHFNVAPSTGDSTTIFRFDGSDSTDSDGRIVKWIWDFGDRTSGQGNVINHRYPRSDTFPVTLTVVDDNGLEGSVNKSVEVKGRPPVAAFAFSPASGDTSTTFHFDGSASTDPDGTIVSYQWKFGGGSAYEGRSFSRQFPEDGRYSVDLTVTDNEGRTDTSETQYIDVRTDGGGGGGGGGGGSDPCTPMNWDGQAFKVVDVSGRVITADVTFILCPHKCPEVMRNATGICEFVGDASNIHDNQTTFDPGTLPASCLPVTGEILKMVWKHCD
jgi:PKD domain-containing protein